MSPEPTSSRRAFFFFQAEDGIRDGHVTGVQTCALPICLVALAVSALTRSARVAGLAFVGLWAGVEIVRGVLTQMADRREAEVLSFQQDLRVVGNALFGIAERTGNLPVGWPALTLAVVVVACLFVLR